MSAEYRHRRYFRIRLADNSLYNFTSTADANIKIDFKNSWLTSNPKKIEELIDSNQTFLVTYEFNNETEQTAFMNAIDSEWNIDTNDESTPWNGDNSTQTVENFKTEWLDPTDAVSSTFDLDLAKIELTGGMRGGRFVIDF